MLVGGTALGLYSRFTAGSAPLRDQIGRLSDVAGVPSFLGLLAAVAGGFVLLAWLGALVAERAFGSHWWVTFGLVGSFAGVIWLSVGSDELAHVGRIRREYVAFPQLTTAVAAWLLVLAGILAMLPLAFRRERAALGAAVVGMCAATVVGATAVALGDDTRNIDATTAAAADVPAVPLRVGAKAYEMRRATVDVVSAGTGFVAADAQGITAYDGTAGTERWHYRRTGGAVQYAAGSLRAVSGGKIVIAAWGPARTTVQAFDAVTGARLWGPGSAFVDEPGRPATISDAPGELGLDRLVKYNSRAVSGYDVRTGARTWRVEAPEKCRIADAAAVADATYFATLCDEDKVVTLHAHHDGGALDSREVARADKPQRFGSFRVHGNVAEANWNDADYLLLHKPDQLAGAAVEKSSKRMVADPDSSDLVYDRPAGNYPVFATPPQVDNGVPLPGFSFTMGERRVTFLKDVVLKLGVNDDKALAIFAWNRTDGRELPPTNVQAPGEFTAPAQLLRVPGAVLVVTDDQLIGIVA